MKTTTWGSNHMEFFRVEGPLNLLGWGWWASKKDLLSGYGQSDIQRSNPSATCKIKRYMSEFLSTNFPQEAVNLNIVPREPHNSWCNLVLTTKQHDYLRSSPGIFIAWFQRLVIQKDILIYVEKGCDHEEKLNSKMQIIHGFLYPWSFLKRVDRVTLKSGSLVPGINIKHVLNNIHKKMKKSVVNEWTWKR